MVIGDEWLTNSVEQTGPTHALDRTQCHHTWLGLTTAPIHHLVRDSGSMSPKPERRLPDGATASHEPINGLIGQVTYICPK